MKIIIGLLMLCLIVVAHEFGHLILAKANHIEVKEFWVGFGPKIFSFTVGETKYCLRLIPLGGACLFEDPELPQEGEEEADGKAEDDTDVEAVAKAEDDNNVEAVTDADTDAKLKKKKVSYLLNEAPIWGKIGTLVAGPFFNFLLAFLLGIVVCAFSFMPSTKITDVVDSSPAMEAGLKAGDEIVKVNGSRVYLYPEVSVAIQLGIGKPVRLEYERDGKRVKTELIPELDEESGSYIIGVMFGGNSAAKEKNVGSVLSDSYKYVRYMVKVTYQSFGMLLTGKASMKEMSGPVGVVSLVADEYDAAASVSGLAIVVSMFNIAVLLSANLGVINLLPFPMLDGGKLVFALYELITGNKPNQKIETAVNSIGAMLLILFMIIVLFNDVMKLFTV